MRKRFMLVLTAVSSLTACLPCPPDFETRSFPIDAAQAAMVVDATGQPIGAACQRICNGLQMPPDGSALDGAFPDAAAPDAGILPLFHVDPSSPVECELVSRDSVLEVRCRWERWVMCYG